MSDDEMLCTKCKDKTPTDNIGSAYSKNGKLMKTGLCVICRTKKQTFAPTKNVKTILSEENTQSEQPKELINIE